MIVRSTHPKAPDVQVFVPVRYDREKDAWLPLCEENGFFYSAIEAARVCLIHLLSMWMLVAVQVSSMFMRRLPRHLWKGIHLLSYLMLWSGIIHGVQAGTDSGNPVYVWSMAAMALIVVFLTFYRIVATRRTRRPAASREREEAFSGPSGTAT